MNSHDFPNCLELWHPLNPQLKQRLLNCVKKQDFKKDAHLLKTGQVCRRIWYLRKGIVRRYYHYQEKERTTWIEMNGGIITDMKSINDQRETEENIQAIEDCETFYIDFFDLLAIYQGYPEFKILLYTISDRRNEKILAHREALRTDAGSKYRYLLSNFSEMVNHVPVAYLASFMDMSIAWFYKFRRAKKKDYKNEKQII
ncbi:MAG: cyclic nucleotide-binding domain-containing protein [Bacteroidota bacterium]